MHELVVLFQTSIFWSKSSKNSQTFVNHSSEKTEPQVSDHKNLHLEGKINGKNTTPDCKNQNFVNNCAMASNIGAFMVRDLENLFIPMLRNCSTMMDLMKIHANIVKHNVSRSNFLVTKMVVLCDKSGEIDYARLLFKQVLEPNIFLCNAMIRAYTHQHMYVLAIDLYKQMLRYSDGETLISPDNFTFPFVVKSCAGNLCHVLGKQTHAHVWKFGANSNNVTENALIDMYTKCDNFVDAHKVFDEMSETDVISWNCLISGYLRSGHMDKAKSMFEQIPNKTIVSWTAMISGYMRAGQYVHALDVFRRMQAEGVKPDEISIISVLPACAQLGALELGKWIHMYADKKGFLSKTFICNALIEMYAKCGNITQALQLFDQMSGKDVISWSTMIAGLANHGKARAAIEMFGEMKKTKIAPNAITFLSILLACAHAGFLNEGLVHFDSMTKEYCIDPEIEHFSCLVDLLGRSGFLERALEIIKNMPMNPDSKIWGSLLSSCRTYSNLDIAIIAMDKLLELEPDDTGNYVLLSNIYADLGKWEGVSSMRKLIRSKSMKKTPGCSSIEVNNLVEEFVSGDDSKPFSKQIFLVLQLLSLHQSKSEDVQSMSENEI